VNQAHPARRGRGARSHPGGDLNTMVCLDVETIEIGRVTFARVVRIRRHFTELRRIGVPALTARVGRRSPRRVAAESPAEGVGIPESVRSPSDRLMVSEAARQIFHGHGADFAEIRCQLVNCPECR
jgi:hypothetical protein